ncbi:MAG: chorismate synthase [Kiritimatiellaeota bacterium]|nr:chorismate synthase [Kiritimatiellota bacterium]
MSSTWGHNLKISLFGESHGPAVGVTLDGLPPSEALDLDAIQKHLARRAPGANIGDTPRREPDAPEILSGFFNGKTTGTPLCAIIRNHDAQSADYSTIEKPRPGHADLTGALRYNHANDPRGGGHFSGRLTAPLTFAGAVCLQILARRGVTIHARIVEIAGIADGEKILAAIQAARGAGDSVGGIVECVATGLPAGLGDPIFGNVESRVASLLFAIPAVKGVEFGAGFGVARMRGSQCNDAPFYDGDGEVRRASNNAGGIEGGITNGMPLVVRCAFKPTPSIALTQSTVNLATRKNDTLETKGRHDACIVPRAVPVVESAVAIALLDLMKT